ncbi:MAG: PaaI family thioesterase [Pseudomonadota bacterium]
MAQSKEIDQSGYAEVENLNKLGANFLPGYLGIEFRHMEPGRTIAALPIKPHLLAPNGFLHAGSVITLADTACGYGCVAALPEGASGFTTVELKSNFLGTALSGEILCEAKAKHLGRSTQLWDAEVTYTANTDAEPKTIALFRCTQMVLWPKPNT